MVGMNVGAGQLARPAGCLGIGILVALFPEGWLRLFTNDVAGTAYVRRSVPSRP